MNQSPPDSGSSGSADDGSLKYYRHPYQSTTYYAAHDGNRVRVKLGEQWGEFDRDGNYLAGTVRSADPCFCRWVSGEHLYNERIKAANSPWHVLTRSARERST